MVSSVGYNPARRIAGANFDRVDLRLIVTDLCVMDFGGPDHAIRVVMLDPGVTFDQLQEATGLAHPAPAEIGDTDAPTAGQLALIARLDPHNLIGRAPCTERVCQAVMLEVVCVLRKKQ